MQYDAKLTTPPGLYAISVGLAKVLPGWECADVVWLRATNLVLLLTLPVLIARVLHQQDANLHHLQTVDDKDQVAPKNDSKKPPSRREIERLQQEARREQPPSPDASLDQAPEIAPESVHTQRPSRPTVPSPRSTVALPIKPKRQEATPYTMAVACTICFLPPLWFFGFLYYTDLASVWLVMACLMLYNHLNRTRSFATALLLVLSSTLAVLVRQTNLVWVAFCTAHSILYQLQPRATLQQHGESVGLVWEVRAAIGDAVAKERRAAVARMVARNVAPVVPMLAGCAWFVRWNGGSIVLGDKANHQAGVHFPQLGYFLLFATAFGLFPLLHALSAPPSARYRQSDSRVFALVRCVKNSITTVAQTTLGSVSSIVCLAVALAGFWWAADRFTIDHPFLLADNRHYTFYLWRLFRRSYTLPLMRSVHIQLRFALVPVYAAALFAWAAAVGTRGLRLDGVLLAGATAATLIPTPLVEPRYYLLPYLMLRLSVQPSENAQQQHRQPESRIKWAFLALELATYALVNLITLWLFVAKPFQWSPEAVDKARAESTTMRFIW